MNFKKFLIVIKARIKAVLSIFLVIVLAAIIITYIMPKRYDASTTLVLNYKGVDPVTGVVLPAQLMPGYMSTQIDILTSRNVALKVVKTLKLSESEAAREQFYQATQGQGDIDLWFANLLLRSLKVIPDKKSSVLEVIFSGSDPNFAALIANKFAEAYQQSNVELKVQPARKAALFFNEQIEVLKNRLEKAQLDLATYQQENEITSTSGALDIEVAKLNEISTQLVGAQSQLYDSKSRSGSSNRNPFASPDIATNPIVQQMKLTVSLAETKFSEVSEVYGRNHPQYKVANAELTKARSNLSKAVANAKKNVSETNIIDKKRVSELTKALEDQKKKVLKLNLASNELAVLQNEVMSAQKALDSVNARYTQTDQESHANQSDITVLNPAVPPTTYTSPNMLINLAVSLFLGAVFGVMTGFMIEYFDQRLRSKDDIVNILEVPVFSLSKPKNQNRKLVSFPFKLLNHKA